MKGAMRYRKNTMARVDMANRADRSDPANWSDPDDPYGWVERKTGPDCNLVEQTRLLDKKHNKSLDSNSFGPVMD
ncbi:hypothetical protein Tco_0840553 [Tanacetum coccineum]|uniref:Uncharacterized protein n=1 Tax=Tanacetum coccineum TaxID=301880 RepID=A0ABQ5AY87_9ASTR